MVDYNSYIVQYVFGLQTGLIKFFLFMDEIYISRIKKYINIIQMNMNFKGNYNNTFQ